LFNNLCSFTDAGPVLGNIKRMRKLNKQKLGELLGRNCCPKQHDGADAPRACVLALPNFIFPIAVFKEFL